MSYGIDNPKGGLQVARRMKSLRIQHKINRAIIQQVMTGTLNRTHRRMVELIERREAGKRRAQINGRAGKAS